MADNFRHVRVSFDYLARWRELTQRETHVFTFIVGSRNAKTGRCNPSRSLIAEFLGYRLTDIWVAINGLEKKGWIIDGSEGFQIIPADQIPAAGSQIGNVPKLGTFPKKESGVPKSGTKVPKLGTNNKGSSEQCINNEGTNKRAPTRIPDPFPLTQEMADWANANVPAVDLLFAHLEFVEHWTNCQTKKAAAVDWLLRWKKGMKLRERWDSRDRAENAAAAHVGRDNGNARPPPPAPTPCRVCGKMFCLNLHRDSINA